jgi:hypothetical protein
MLKSPAAFSEVMDMAPSQQMRPNEEAGASRVLRCRQERLL